MTRFARSKGSKASNERHPEAATPWSEMKQQLLQKKHDDDNKEKREEANARKINIYKEFLAERRKNESKETKWAEFPGVKKPEKISKVNQQKKKEKMLLGMKALSDNQKAEKSPKKKSPKKQNKDELDVEEEDDFDIEEGASADESSDEFYDLKAKLDKVLDTEEFREANGEAENSNTDIHDEGSDDDVPEESTSKVEPPKVKVSKAKQKKKTKLEIPAENVPKTQTAQNEQDTSVKAEKKKKGKKNKASEKQVNGNKKNGKDSKIVKKPINLDELGEKERKIVERKMRKRKRQAERRQLKRAQKAAEKEAQGKDGINNGEEQSANSTQQNGNTKRSNEEPHLPVNNKRLKTSDEGQDKRLIEQLGQKNLANNKEKTKKPQVKKEKQKKFDADKARRKPLSEKTMINGKAIDLEYVDGFPIKKEDADRLKQLKKQMISKGLPRSEINNALKLERRRAEKALTRLKKEVCFNCRMSGHNLSECPQLNNGDPAHTMPMDICFKCGSTEHKSYECKVVKGDSFKFATCFICKEQGHLSKQCPDNPRGLYPKGGACNVCGDVTHLKKDCPQYQAQQGEQDTAKVGLMGESNPEDMDGSGWNKSAGVQKRPNKVIKF